VKFGLPSDAGQGFALALALVAFLVVPKMLVASRTRPTLVIGVLAAIAAALSAAYVVVYLRGGPRIIDATSYFLEARAMAHGLFAWKVPEPETSVLGRFLVRSANGEVAVIFPPGYPAFLALGFLARAPLAMGPILAACLVVATAALASQIVHTERDEARRRDVIVLAAVASAVCGALRYHTADTMSHGLSALCFTAALALVLFALSRKSARSALLCALAAGFFAGWLVATRPVSGLALAATLVLALARARQISPSALATKRITLALALGVGAIPGVLLLLAHQRAATGSLGASSQTLYYAQSDGPPGCFRYGFGEGIGCLGEHFDFVERHLANGFGVLAALGTTLRRLRLHLLDACNAEPLFALVLVGLWVARRSPRVRLLALGVCTVIVAYSPFYFDGNYPAGGARFYADILPLEHVLVAMGVAHLANLGPNAERAPRRAAVAIALTCAAFAFRAGFDHALLAMREGSIPMFEPARLAASGIDRGLVFTTTDHGFDLAYDPSPDAPIQIARLHGDALDRMTWRARGEPDRAFVYDFRMQNSGPALIEIREMIFDHDDAIEGESLWPARRQTGGWALPDYASGTCASRGRWLRIRRDRFADKAQIELTLPARALRGVRITPRIASNRAGAFALRVVAGGVTTPLEEHTRDPPGDCRTLTSFEVPDAANDLRLVVEFSGSEADLFALDSILLDQKTH
jgi:hypothetical protein